MARLGRDAAIELDVALAVVDERIELHERQVALGREGQRFRAVGGDVERRVRALDQGRRQRGGLLDVEEPPAMDEQLVRPQALQNLDQFAEHGARIRGIDAERLVFDRLAAAADADVEPPARHLVEHRRFLGDEERIAERQHVHHVAEPHPVRARSRRRDHQIGRRHRRGRRQVVLEEPVMRKSHRFGERELVEVLAIDLARGQALAVAGIVPDREFHGLAPQYFTGTNWVVKIWSFLGFSVSVPMAIHESLITSTAFGSNVPSSRNIEISAS